MKLKNISINQVNICGALYNSELATNNLMLYRDLNNGNVYVEEMRKLLENEILISYYEVPQRRTKKALNEFAKPIKSAYWNYRKGHTICKSTAIKRYGKKFMETQIPFATLPNPSYGKADDMQLFDTEALEYNFKLNE